LFFLLKNFPFFSTPFVEVQKKKTTVPNFPPPPPPGVTQKNAGCFSFERTPPGFDPQPRPYARDPCVLVKGFCWGLFCPFFFFPLGITVPIKNFFHFTPLFFGSNQKTKPSFPHTSPGDAFCVFFVFFCQVFGLPRGTLVGWTRKTFWFFLAASVSTKKGGFDCPRFVVGLLRVPPPRCSPPRAPQGVKIPPGCFPPPPWPFFYGLFFFNVGLSKPRGPGCFFPPRFFFSGLTIFFFSGPGFCYPPEKVLGVLWSKLGGTLFFSVLAFFFNPAPNTQKVPPPPWEKPHPNPKNPHPPGLGVPCGFFWVPLHQHNFVTLNFVLTPLWWAPNQFFCGFLVGFFFGLGQLVGGVFCPKSQKKIFFSHQSPAPQLTF